MSALPTPPAGTTELGIDIIKVERIQKAIRKHGRRFAKRVLTDHEDAYVRDRPENFAGRWAAKEAVSKVLGLGVRGVGWREIEIIRLPPKNGARCNSIRRSTSTRFAAPSGTVSNH